ncbi:hypothetical protein BH09ACT8_BH09ACT8_23350 [soil metagenome]
MVENPAVAQAFLLLAALHEQVSDISDKLQAAERNSRNLRSRGAAVDQRRALQLRKDLYEAHRLIDGLHRRFPDVRPAPTPRTANDPRRTTATRGHPPARREVHPPVG